MVVVNGVLVKGTRDARVEARGGDVRSRRGVELPGQAAMAEDRRNLDGEAQYALALFGDHARAVHDRDGVCETCSMCGDLCAIKIVEKALEKKI